MSSAEPFPAGVDWLAELRQNRVAAIKHLQDVRKTTVFVFWNLDGLRREDFFTLVDVLEEEAPSTNLDLVILSPGGSGEAGYRIGHSFQQWAKHRNLRFSAIVPNYAKSAATIACLGADEIVMGLHSELGPIDPQIPKYDASSQSWRYIPAMAVFDGMKLISEYLAKIPQMSRFFEEMVANERLSLVDLGVLERARESGKQYGESLLLGGMISDAKNARIAVDRLSDYYRYHDHPIDGFEAEQQLKLKIAHSQGEEWNAIKALRDGFDEFVGVSVVPGVVAVSAVETVNMSNWRYAPSEAGTDQPADF